MGVLEPGKPQGRDARMGKPLIKTLQAVIPHSKKEVKVLISTF